MESQSVEEAEEWVRWLTSRIGKKDDEVCVRFPGNKNGVNCYLTSLSSTAPPPLPGSCSGDDEAFCAAAAVPHVPLVARPPPAPPADGGPMLLSPRLRLPSSTAVWLCRLRSSELRNRRSPP